MTRWFKRRSNRSASMLTHLTWTRRNRSRPRCGELRRFAVRSGLARLLDATVTVLDGLATRDDLRSELSELLRAMVAYGDLVELTPPADQTGSARLLYLAPPTFVQTVAGTFVLLGIRPEGAPLVDEALLPSIRYERHTRTISGEDPEAVVASLKASGLQEINQARWLRLASRDIPRVGRR